MRFNWLAFIILIIYSFILYFKGRSDGKQVKTNKDYIQEELEFYKFFSQALNLESLIKEGIIKENDSLTKKQAQSIFPYAMKEAICRKEWNSKHKNKEK